MEAWRAARIIVALLASFSLASCAGNNSDNYAGGGIGGTGYVSNGTITAFGSIVVNDIEFDTTNADVIIGGRPKGTGNQAVLNNLDVGQTVIVEGTENDDGKSGTATRVRFTPHVKGPVTRILEIDKTTKRVVIIILGQTIITDGDTVIKNITADGLAPNNLIEVSGLMGVAGTIRATHIRKIADSFDPATEVEGKGIVRLLDFNAKTFKLNDLVVAYGQAEIGGLPDRKPRIGELVYVRGKVGKEGTLEATEIELADEAGIANVERFALEGFITDFVPPSDFMVGNVQVQASEDTKFIGGLKGEIAAGARIRVRGRLVAGILQAQQIFFRK